MVVDADGTVPAPGRDRYLTHIHTYRTEIHSLRSGALPLSGLANGVMGESKPVLFLHVLIRAREKRFENEPRRDDVAVMVVVTLASLIEGVVAALRGAAGSGRVGVGVKSSRGSTRSSGWTSVVLPFVPPLGVADLALLATSVSSGRIEEGSSVMGNDWSLAIE